MGAGVAAVGLAGCSAVPGICGTPGDDIEAALPSGGEFEQLESRRNGGGGVVERGAVASYEGPEGERFIVLVAEYTSESDAKDVIEDAQSTGEGSTLGVVRVGRHVYAARGPEEGPVKNLLSAMGPLDRVCVERTVTWY